jgi:hypothetical protein
MTRTSGRNSAQPLRTSILRLYEQQLRTHGHIILSAENAELLRAARELKIVDDPRRPGLVRVEIHDTQRRFD